MTFEQWMEEIHQLFSEKFLIIRAADYPDWDWREDYANGLMPYAAFQNFLKDS